MSTGQSLESEFSGDSRLRRGFGVMVAVVCAWTMGCGGGGSAPGGGDVSVFSPAWTIPHETSEDIAGYWTAARVRAAKPIERTIAGGPGETDLTLPSGAEALAIEPSAPAGVTFRAGRVLQPDVEKCTKLSANEVCWSRIAWAGERTQLPSRTFGKVTFDKEGDPGYVCSAAVVTSENKSVIWTAGHCVMQEGVRHTNWAFAPGYRNGDAPFGWWRPRDSSSIFVPKEWEEDENSAFDFAAVVVEPNDGVALEDKVGSQGIRFEEAPPEEVDVFGYPGGKPFDGEYLYSCRSPAPVWLRDKLVSSGEPTIGVGCDQSGGSSGGPFVAGTFNDVPGWGWVVSNVSYDWALRKDEFTFGPYLGPEAKALWQEAQSR